MKKFEGYKPEKTTTRELLPAGGYVAKILDAKVVTYDWGDKLEISFDIADGEYKDFFKRDYNGQPSEEKKWRGVLRLNVPKDDGTEKDGWSKNAFNRALGAVEYSNSGYHWEWNEATLKGKTVGVLYRNKEWEYDGNTGWTTECCAFADVADIREGKFKMPKDKPLKEKTTTTTAAAFSQVPAEDDSELPF